MTTTKKLFHAIVVIGMATAGAACSSSTVPADASTGNDGSSANDASNTKDVSAKDVATNDTGTTTDAGGDGMPAWLGC